MNPYIDGPSGSGYVIDPARDRSLRTVGHISYALHAIVAVGAVLPGVQGSIGLLLVAFFLDLFKRGDALGSWQESHFVWRIRSVIWAGGLYVLTIPLWFLFILPGWIAWGLISLWFLYRVIRGVAGAWRSPSHAAIAFEIDSMNHDPNCIFCKIVAGQIPSKKVHEDAELLAFHDIAPWAPVHFLIIPKTHIASLYDVDAERDQALLGRMLALAPKLMREKGVTNGFRTIVNNGVDGGQEVAHLHLHAIGGPRPWAKG